jgi:hypothetical protein
VGKFAVVSVENAEHVCGNRAPKSLRKIKRHVLKEVAA